MNFFPWITTRSRGAILLAGAMAMAAAGLCLGLLWVFPLLAALLMDVPWLVLPVAGVAAGVAGVVSLRLSPQEHPLVIGGPSARTLDPQAPEARPDAPAPDPVARSRAESRGVP